MFLIMSGAYVDNELQSEFGAIPPSFLPLGNRRLFQHQVKLAPTGSQVYLTIPEKYKVPKTDSIWLDENNVNIILVPEKLSLGASLVAALNLTESSLENPLHVLFGDTLFEKLPAGDDIIGVSQAQTNYNWASITSDGKTWLKDNSIVESSDPQNIVNGYFKFSQPRMLMRFITQKNWNFANGLNKYHEKLGLVSSYSVDWLDFGHVNTYYNSKANFTTQRDFNELTITSDWIEKSSVKNSKIAAEANWFEKLPYSLRGFIPQYLGSNNEQGKVSYKLEYLHQTALNELYVFSELPVHIWDQIFASCVKFFKKCSLEYAPAAEPANEITELFGKKTQARLNEYCEENNINLNALWLFNGEQISLQQIIDESNIHLPDNKLNRATVLHGDFCFSNILFDFRSNRIKTIDPRGTTQNGELTIYGDIRYDIAKLSHSVIGMYDWIIAGCHSTTIVGNEIFFHLEENGKHKEIQQHFIELIEKEFSLSSVQLMAMQIQLFLSMLPLHKDDLYRQKGLFANAFRLYELMKRLEK
jgi:hypothetical protein